MSDRNDGYVPDRLLLDGQPCLVEIAPPRDGQPVLARETIGDPDEHNRDSHWRWVDVSGNGTHWSHFQGHHVQVDIELHTENRREVNDWKSRDEVRAEGTWTLALARQQVWEGFVRSNPLDQLIEIRRVAQLLLDHNAIDWRAPTPVAEQLLGRRVYYQRTPAVISSTGSLLQGCVMLKPVGVPEFPPAAYALDRAENYDDERDEIKTDLLDTDVWWWRDKPAGDEEDLRPVYDPEAEGKAAPDVTCPGLGESDGSHPEPPPPLTEAEQIRDRLYFAETALQRIREAIGTDEPVTDSTHAEAAVQRALAVVDAYSGTGYHAGSATEIAARILRDVRNALANKEQS